MIILETKRLFLETVNTEDIDILYNLIFCDDEVIKYTFGSENFSKKETFDFIKQNCNFDKKIGLSVLKEKTSNKIVGLAGIVECDYLGRKDYEFGFILGRAFWKKGFASEIGKAQIDFIKNSLQGKRALALAHKENLSSLACLKKLGLEYFSTVTTKNRGDREVYILDF